MRSYRVHACTPEADGKIPYLVLSLCGAERVSIDMCGMQGGAAKRNDAIALTLEALHELLRGNAIKSNRKDGAIRLCPDGAQLIIQRDGSYVTHRVWMAEIALAWNMLAGPQTRHQLTGWKLQ